MKFAFIQEEKANYPVRVLCDVLEVSRSGFYASLNRKPSVRARENETLLEEIRVAHKKSRGTYGSPRIHHGLKKKRPSLGKNRIARLMREDEIVGRKRKKFCLTTDSNHDFPVAENLLDRRFEATAPNTVWVSDITYIRTGEGWLYLAMILDLFSRRIVGYAMSSSIDRTLVLAALDNALASRSLPKELLFHSDRGSQYASDDFQEKLRAHGITWSMSRRGNCWDNAVAESFFGTLKSETEEEYETRLEARTSITDYIDNFYNLERMHSSLDYLSPIEYELKHLMGQMTS